jgi:hypothetical protein
VAPLNWSLDRRSQLIQHWIAQPQIISHLSIFNLDITSQELEHTSETFAMVDSATANVDRKWARLLRTHLSDV